MDEDDVQHLRQHITKTIADILYEKKAEGHFFPRISRDIKEAVMRALAPYAPEYEVKATQDPDDPTKVNITLHQKMIQIQFEIPKEDI